MSSASRSILMTACSVSLSLPTTRSWSPWMRTWTLGDTFWIRLRRSRAMSSVMPALRFTSIWPRPLPTVFGSPALKSLGESWRRAAFSRSTWSAARARSSLADSIRMESARWSYTVAVSLKSKRVDTSRRAWSTALVSSIASNSDTTSKENSATGRRQDCVHAHDDGHHGEGDTDKRGHHEERADSGRPFVNGLERRPVVGVGTVVEVVEAFAAGASDELLQDRFAARGQRPALEAVHRLFEVVSGTAQLGHDHVQRLGRRGGGTLAAEVGDDAVEAHSRDS